MWKMPFRKEDRRPQGSARPKVTQPQQHIIDQITTEEHKEGNDIADGLATRAYEAYKDVKEYANLITHRTQLYIECVQVIQLTIVRVIDAIQERRRTMTLFNPAQTRTYAKGAKKRPMVLRPLGDQGAADKDITFNTIHEAGTQGLTTKWPHHNFIHNLKEFITELEVRIPGEGRHGISWLELCILFEHRQEETVPDDLAKATGQNQRILPTLAQLRKIVNNFSVATRRIIDAAPGGRPHKSIWAARAAAGHRFKSLGSLAKRGDNRLHGRAQPARRGPHYAHGVGAARPQNRQWIQQTQRGKFMGAQKAHQPPTKKTLQFKSTSPTTTTGTNPLCLTNT